MKYREDFKLALLEVEKACKTEFMSNKIYTPSPPSVRLFKTPQHNTVRTQPPTPLGMDKNESKPNTNSLSNFSQKSVDKRDASVGTPQYLDLEFQIKSLTDKCISLQKNLIDEKEKNTNNFHHQILIQELNKFKLENKNLHAVIETLETDKKILENENLQLTLMTSNCIHCYPPLVHRRTNEPSWPVSNVHGTTVLNTDAYSSKFTNHLNHCPMENQGNKENICKKIDFLRNETPSSNKPSHTISGTKKKPHLVILADSHGKQLGNLIQQRTPFNVCSTVKSGARFDKVTHDIKKITKELKEDDHLLILAGTNNIENTSVVHLMDEINNLITVSKHNNLLLATLPMRHDQPGLALKVSRVNAEIEKLSMNNPNMKIVPLHILPRHNFTTHGLHMNRRGKRKAAEMVCSLLQQKLVQPLETHTNKSFKPPTSGITIVDAKMSSTQQEAVNPQVQEADNDSSSVTPTVTCGKPSSQTPDRTLLSALQLNVNCVQTSQYSAIVESNVVNCNQDKFIFEDQIHLEQSNTSDINSISVNDTSNFLYQ